MRDIIGYTILVDGKVIRSKRDVGTIRKGGRVFTDDWLTPEDAQEFIDLTLSRSERYTGKRLSVGVIYVEESVVDN